MGATKGKIDMSIKRTTLVDFEGFEIDLSKLSILEIRALETNILLKKLLEETEKTNQYLAEMTGIELNC